MIEINGMTVTQVPIKPKEISFDKDGKKTVYVDAEGKVVKKLQLQGAEYKWIYADTELECEGKTYKSFKGQPVKGFSKTTVIMDFKRIEVSDLNYFVSNELTYLLVGGEFKEWIKTQKCISFKYVNRGFKVYESVAYYDKALDKVFMRCFRGNLKQLELLEHESVKEIGVEDNVKSLSFEELEA